MEQFLRKLKRVLKTEFAGASTDIDITVPGHKVGGYLIWKGFTGLEQIDRQEKLWNFINEKLTPDERKSISILMTLTPVEASYARKS